MEKIELNALPKSDEENPVKLRDFYMLVGWVNEIIDHLNDKNCSPITCPFNTLIDQLAKRTKKLEFYDKQHRKEHSKRLK